MTVRIKAIRKLREWLDYCKRVGWPKAAMPGLADLWWKYHDEETGDFKSDREEAK